MIRNDNCRSVESVEQDQEKSVPPHSRRGFLKQAAATGILGMTGVSVATETSSAAEVTDQPRPLTVTEPSSSDRADQSESPSTTAAKTRIIVEGGWTTGGSYGLETTEALYAEDSVDSEDDILNDPELDYHGAYGNISPYGKYIYYTYGDIVSINTIGGASHTVE